MTIKTDCVGAAAGCCVIRDGVSAFHWISAIELACKSCARGCKQLASDWPRDEAQEDEAQDYEAKARELILEAAEGAGIVKKIAALLSRIN